MREFNELPHAFDARIPAGSRCAVVFNSGVLRKFPHGAAIDAHDVVVRFNGGITRGYEEHVGTKSTFRIYNGPYTTPRAPEESCRTATSARLQGEAAHHPVCLV